MKIVLDANVIVAAFATRGLCTEIFKFSIDACEVYASEELLLECTQVLRKKLKVPSKTVDKFTSFLREQFHLINPATVDADACRDQSDLHVLGVAQGSNSKFIISGDKDLLELKKFKKTKIYSPRQFWDYVNSLRQT
ncbi:MAG: putative toxin-antitoxin system toxin component, PIN family [Bdellovibrionales bacterium]|nr:putative toxin-antitoxin system toxin component, PIN family [Bdellovibrionales bacterium]